MNSHRFPLISACVFLLASSAIPSQAAPQPRTRAEFTAAMAKLREGMSTNEVIEILGKPDDIRSQSDPGGISRVNTKEIWCYGANSHLSLPTLGCVYIDQNGQTQESFGGRGQPPQPELFKEEELCELLRLLNTAPGMEGWAYNPLPVIQIVNRLQPLGKEKALAAIGEYVRVSDKWSGFDRPRSGMYLVLAVLFDLPDGIYSFQSGAFGAPSPPPPKDANQIPRFPIAIVDDIPLMLVNGYILAGLASPMENVVEFYRVHGQIRPSKLTPNNDPLSAVAHLTNSSQWIYGDTNLQETKFSPPEDARQEQFMLQEQLLRLIDSVYRLPVDAMGNRLPWDENQRDTRWQKVVSDVSALKIKWDSRQDIYVFQNGTSLAPLKRHVYQRQIWKIEGLGYDEAELVLERQDENWLHVWFNSGESKDAKLIPAVIQLFTIDNPEKPIFTSRLEKIKGTGGYQSQSAIHALKAGSEVIGKLVTVNHQTNSSPVFKP